MSATARSVPYMTCPHCEGEGNSTHTYCEWCRGSGLAAKCPHCGESSYETKYAQGFHEHTCLAGHVWRIY